jgi:hypothetical protein
VPRPPLDAPPVRPDDASAEPVVRITIGRVEVRAVLPPPVPRPRREPPAPKTLSLDEYLDRRHGGKR